jgi:hypothetical protein
LPASKDYLPFDDARLIPWVQNAIAEITAHATPWEIIVAKLAPIQALFATYQVAYAVFQAPNHGKLDTRNKNDARDALKSALREFAKAYLLYNPALSNADRELIGLHIHDAKPSSTPAPSTILEYDIDTSIQNRLSVNIWNVRNKRKDKPDGVHGAEIAWEVRTTPPAKAEDLSNSAFSTRTPYTFKFTGDQRGQVVYFCLRWKNNKGEKGPWGEIVSAVIP